MTRIVTIAVTLCSFLLLSGDAGLAKDVTGSDPIVMTYWEAKEAGYHVPLLPSETGMRVCTEADFHPGFPSAEALEKSLREYEAKWGEAGSPGDCQVDPTKASIIFLGSTGGLSALTPPAERPAPQLGRVVYHSASRRFELNGHLPTEVRQALGGLRL